MIPGSGRDGEGTMAGDHFCPIDEHLPPGEPRGCVLIVSDYRPLNLGHASVLCLEGLAVYTAVTCTDVPRLFERYSVGDLDLIVFASLVHGWHHREGEGRPEDIPLDTDADWQIRNMKAVLDLVCGRQANPPRVVIAEELMTYGWYHITVEALAEAGLDYQTYSASDPHAIVKLLH